MSLKDVNWGPLLTPSKPLSTNENGFISSKRQELALQRLSQFNMARAEAWRYTSLKRIVQLKLMSDAQQTEPNWQLSLNEEAIKASSASMLLNSKLRIISLSELAKQDRDQLAEQAFVWIEQQFAQDETMHDLHSLHYRDGLVVIVEAGQDAGELCINMKREKSQVSAQTAIANTLQIDSRNIWFYLAEDAALKVIESFETEQGLQNHTQLSLTSMYLSKNSKLDYVRSQEQSRGNEQTSLHLGRVAATVYAEANLSLTSLNLGSDLCRLELDISLEESQARADLSGLYLGSSDVLLDQHLTLKHKAPSCRSSQSFKGALGAKSRGVFTGRVIVSQGAFDTVAEQNNPNLLLSESAKAVTRPQLEIYNDDVECSHGATVGQLDEDALFYLRARGLDEAAALRALTSAFVGEIRETLPKQNLKRALDSSLKQSLGLELELNEAEEWIDWELISANI